MTCYIIIVINIITAKLIVYHTCTIILTYNETTELDIVNVYPSQTFYITKDLKHHFRRS